MRALRRVRNLVRVAPGQPQGAQNPILRLVLKDSSEASPEVVPGRPQEAQAQILRLLLKGSREVSPECYQASPREAGTHDSIEASPEWPHASPKGERNQSSDYY